MANRCSKVLRVIVGSGPWSSAPTFAFCVSLALGLRESEEEVGRASASADARESLPQGKQKVKRVRAVARNRLRG